MNKRIIYGLEFLATLTAIMVIYLWLAGRSRDSALFSKILFQLWALRFWYELRYTKMQLESASMHKEKPKRGLDDDGYTLEDARNSMYHMLMMEMQLRNRLIELLKRKNDEVLDDEASKIKNMRDSVHLLEDLRKEEYHRLVNEARLQNQLNE